MRWWWRWLERQLTRLVRVFERPRTKVPAWTRHRRRNKTSHCWRRLVVQWELWRSPAVLAEQSRWRRVHSWSSLSYKFRFLHSSAQILQATATSSQQQLVAPKLITDPWKKLFLSSFRRSHTLSLGDFDKVWNSPIDTFFQFLFSHSCKFKLSTRWLWFVHFTFFSSCLSFGSITFLSSSSPHYFVVLSLFLLIFTKSQSLFFCTNSPPTQRPKSLRGSLDAAIEIGIGNIPARRLAGTTATTK